MAPGCSHGAGGRGAGGARAARLHRLLARRRSRPLRLDPENPEQPSGRQIRLSVVVVPALLEPAGPDAFTYLAGGPGGAATDAVPAALTFWRDTHLRHDMLFVDQRGTGG